MAKKPRRTIGVVGSGIRERALVEAILRSEPDAIVYAIPGNDGMDGMKNVIRVVLSASDVKGIGWFACKNKLELVIPGPEDVIFRGIADECAKHAIPCCAPLKKVAKKVEYDKAVFKRQILIPCGIPTAAFRTFTDPEKAIEYILERGVKNTVLKAAFADAGKGVIIYETEEEARAAVHELMVDPENKHKGAGRKVLVEDRLAGEGFWELSATGLLDGKRCNVRMHKYSCDHKRVGEGDTGGMTGGMGAHTFNPPIEVVRKVEEYYARIAERLRQMGCPYTGVLYLGLMVAPDGTVYVLEGNCRFGDPEAEVVLPVIGKSVNIVDLLLAAATGDLRPFDAIENEGEAFCIMLCDPGYPGKAELDAPLDWIPAVEKMGVDVLLAGVKRHKDGTLTSNYAGRVVGLRVVAKTYQAARRKANRAAERATAGKSNQKLKFRRDLGRKVKRAA